MSSHSIRSWVHRTLFDVNGRNSLPRSLEKFINWLIVANLLALLLEHIPSVHEGNETLFHDFDVASVVFFTIEYFLRFFAAPENPAFAGKRFARLRHAISPYAIIDLLVIAPFWLHYTGLVELDLRALRGLRLLRLLKFLRDVVPAIQAFRVANRDRTLRQKIFSLMNETPTSGRLQSQLDLFFIFFIIISVICVFLETVPEIATPLHEEFHLLDLVAIAVFTTEYLLRLYSAPEQTPEKSPLMARATFPLRPSSMVDLVAILPFYLQFMISVDLRFIRILRVLRVAKLTRYNTAMKTFAIVLQREKRAFAAALFVTFLITILAGAIVYEVEHSVQPDKFDTMFRAMYWAVITLASVGYGDISPITPIGQMFTMFLAILGIGIVALPAGILGSAFTDQLRQDREDMERSIEEALADGILSDDEIASLEEERIRLHLTEEQFAKLKERAVIKRGGLEGDVSKESAVVAMGKLIADAESTLASLPLEEALEHIRHMEISEKQKAALRSLLN